MTILVFSDSHGRVQPMLEGVELYRPDAIFHLGDVVRDGEKVQAAYPDIPFYGVPGNCDWNLRGEEQEKIARLEGKTILFMHGHTAYVKSGIGPALEKAQAIGADLLLFGHTHVPFRKQYDKLLAVNPGAAQEGRGVLLRWNRASEITAIPLEP